MHQWLNTRVLTHVNVHNHVHFVVIRYVNFLIYLLLIYLHAFLLVYVFCIRLRGLQAWTSEMSRFYKSQSCIHKRLWMFGNVVSVEVCWFSTMQFRSFLIPNSHWICRDTVYKVIGDLYPSFKTFFTVQQIASHWDFFFYTEKFDTLVYALYVITVKGFGFWYSFCSFCCCFWQFEYCLSCNCSIVLQFPHYNVRF